MSNSSYNGIQKAAFNDLCAIVNHREVGGLWNLSITVNNVFYTFYRNEKVYSFDGYKKIKEIEKGSLSKDDLWKFHFLPEVTNYLNGRNVIVWEGEDACHFLKTVIADTVGNVFMSSYTLEGIYENLTASEEILTERAKLVA